MIDGVKTYRSLYLEKKGYTFREEDVTLVGVIQRRFLVPWTRDEGEQAAVIQGSLQLDKAFIHGCHHTDVNMHAASIYLNRYSILDMVLKVAQKC